ncbi:MAG: hypothetical protein CMJ81_08660 [Planctomycetaceae bacterium]|nr:hypothetical protein [Planctomycetaceae bacterium]MBP63433.1 hypothetical protein [Planctomycetaceae bacterium]
MFDRWTTSHRQPLTLLLSAASLLAIGILGGCLFTKWTQPPLMLVPEIPVQASGAAHSNTIAAATGPIDDKVEGLFTLDFLTGELQCAVLYTYGPNMNTFGGIYRINVVEDMQIEATKKPNYLLLTGFANYARGGRSGNNRVGASVVYVVDANTGNFAAYGVPWNPNAASRGTPQTGPLIPINKGISRLAPVRE